MKKSQLDFKICLIINLLALACPTISLAEVFHLAKNCSGEKLIFENLSSDKQTFWLQSWTGYLYDETAIVVEPLQNTSITLQHELANDQQHYSILNLNSKIKQNQHFRIKNQCPEETGFKLSDITSDQGGLVKFNTHPLKKIQQLEVINLSPIKNDIYILEYNESEKLIKSQTVNLNSREHKFIQLQLENTTTAIQVYASQNAKFFAKDKNSYVTPGQVKIQKSAPETKAAYFVIGPRQNSGQDLNPKSTHEDQFVVKIKNPNMIEKARDQLRNKKLEKIIFGKITLGHQGFNRNMGSKNKNFWNWSVSEVTNIADIGSTTCNGFPQLVEDRSEFWMNNPGNICFWNYRIKKEITAEELGF